MKTKKTILLHNSKLDYKSLKKKTSDDDDFKEYLFESKCLKIFISLNFMNPWFNLSH